MFLYINYKGRPDSLMPAFGQRNLILVKKTAGIFIKIFKKAVWMAVW